MSGTRILAIALLSMGAAFGLAALNLRVFPAFWSERILDSAQVDDAIVFAPEPPNSGTSITGVPGGAAGARPGNGGSAFGRASDPMKSGDGPGQNRSRASLPKLTATQLAALLAPIYYESGAAELSGVETLRLKELAGFMISRPKRRLLIIGYSTPSGGMRYNRFMASQRSRVVRDRLQDLGVPRRQLVTDGFVYTEQELAQLKQLGENPQRAEMRWFED